MFVKRDDAMALGMGGNKLRSLEFWAGEALDRGCDTLVVGGQAVSNQCRLTAATAAKLGLDCIVLHNDDPPERLDGNSLLSHLYGATTRYLGPVTEEEREEAVGTFAEELRRSGKRPYIVGEPVLGAVGYVVAAEELLRQCATAIDDLQHIVIPGSMGPTEAGLTYGLLAGGFAGQVHIISVEYDALELTGRVLKIFEGMERLLGELATDPATIWRFDDNFLAPGYGTLNNAAADAMQRFAASEAILLEPTYTAKPFAALISMIETGVIAPESSVCALHTGGLPTLFSAQTQSLLETAFRNRD